MVDVIFASAALAKSGTFCGPITGMGGIIVSGPEELR